MSETKKHIMYIVTGAPGSGKSTALTSFLELNSDYIAFDIDWLGKTASNLADRNIFFDESTWKPYANLWFEVLHSIYKNKKIPVFFTANDATDIEKIGFPNWCKSIKWLLLDCNDQIRLKRLKDRDHWTNEMIAEAIDDACVLRKLVDLKIDTGSLSPHQVASKILDWLRNFHSN